MQGRHQTGEKAKPAVRAQLLGKEAGVRLACALAVLGYLKSLVSPNCLLPLSRLPFPPLLSLRLSDRAERKRRVCAAASHRLP